MLEENPICDNDSATYRCTLNGDRVDWEWMNTEISLSERVSFFSSVITTGVTNRTIGGSLVSFNVTALGPPITSVIALVYHPEVINGTIMECGGESLTISITKISKQ